MNKKVLYRISCTALILMLSTCIFLQLASVKVNAIESNSKISVFEDGHSLKNNTKFERMNGTIIKKSKDGFKAVADLTINQEIIKGSFTDVEDSSLRYEIEGSFLKKEKSVPIYTGKVTNMPGKNFEAFLLADDNKAQMKKLLVNVMNEDQSDPISFLFDGNTGTSTQEIVEESISAQGYNVELLSVTNVRGLAFKVRGPSSLYQGNMDYHTIRAWSKTADAKADSGLGSHAFGCAPINMAFKFTPVTNSVFVTAVPTNSETTASLPFWMPYVGVQTIDLTTSKITTENPDTYAKWGFEWSWLTAYVDNWGSTEKTRKPGYIAKVSFDTNSSIAVGTKYPKAKVWVKYKVTSDYGTFINAYPQYECERSYSISVVKPQ